MIAQESAPQLQFPAQRQIVGLSNGASYFPCISHKWDMNFTSDVKMYVFMAPLWFAQKRRKHCISLIERTTFYNFSLKKHIKIQHKKALELKIFFFYDLLSQKE